MKYVHEDVYVVRRKKYVYTRYRICFTRKKEKHIQYTILKATNEYAGKWITCKTVFDLLTRD